jgi:hypothetical protein
MPNRMALGHSNAWIYPDAAVRDSRQVDILSLRFNLGKSPRKRNVPLFKSGERIGPSWGCGSGVGLVGRENRRAEEGLEVDAVLLARLLFFLTGCSETSLPLHIGSTSREVDRRRYGSLQHRSVSLIGYRDSSVTSLELQFGSSPSLQPVQTPRASGPFCLLETTS